MDSRIVKKNSYDFSAVKEVLNEVNNNEFKDGESDFYSLVEGYLSADTSKSYIWTALSAVADDVMESIYQNVLNYIDNVSNIDTCSVKALQSMVQILGTNFSVFDNLADSPVEIIDLINVFSVRKDYLLNSDKVCRQLVHELSGGYFVDLINSYKIEHNQQGFDEKHAADQVKDGSRQLTSYNTLSTLVEYELSRRDSTVVNLSANNFITEKLDNLISSTYYNVLHEHVYRMYGSSSGSDYIYRMLSTDIIKNDFRIPNKYEDLIRNTKIKWNLIGKFDQETEADNIDNGLSVLNDYSEREQNILSIEFLRRTEAKEKLESRTRYAYYKELDVQHYFKFIEKTYNNLSSIYSESDKYLIDKNYIEIKSLGSSIKLMEDSTGAINEFMIVAVAKRLQLITNQIREIREYLKSHAQRNYMKGTFLLISYVVNEYLKNNVYPILPTLGADSNIEYNSDRNKLELVEYVDQTQYNNIFTDIKEDQNDKSLNAEYWIGSGSNGSAVALDSTNIFKPADKLKIVTSSTFTSKEIEDFYLEVLNNQTGLSRQKDKTPLYDFLRTIFQVGADNSYMNSDGKVMCELNNTSQTSSASEWYASRKFTVDIENYIQTLSAAYKSCQYLMEGYEPLPNITYQEQIDQIKLQYDGKAYQEYNKILENAISELQAITRQYDTAITDIEQMNVQFVELTSRFVNLVISQSPNTGDFQMNGSIFANNLARYSSFVNNQTFQQKWTVQQQIDNIQSQYNILFDQAISLAKNFKISTTVELAQATFNDYELTATFPAIVGQPITLSAYYVKQHHEDIGQFETIYNKLYLDLIQLRTNMQSELLKIESSFQTAIMNHKTYAHYSELVSLSNTLCTFINDQENIFDCVKNIKEKLDYTNTDWYHYKQDLFNRYTGLSTSDIPFYYIENVKHPSYQIHPCLSNFIEYVDYSFPINNLANLAQKSIDDIAKTSITINIDNNGYLQSVWNNPLNSNNEYMTKYEKSNHIDKLGLVNKYYGFDGFHHPSDLTLKFNDVLESSLGRGDDRDTIYYGLDLSKTELQKLGIIHSAFNNFLTSIINQMTGISGKILRYGLDVYDNSYILMKINESDTAGILLVKPKNYPIALPAIVYENVDDVPTYREQYSIIDLTYPDSNRYFDNLQMKTFYEVETESDTKSYLTPYFADFTFSSDKTTILLNGFATDETSLNFGNSFAVIANIVQDYQNDYDKQYFVRTFKKDMSKNSVEHFTRPSGLQCVTYYYENRHVGQIYAKKENTNLLIAVQKYNQENVNAQVETAPLISGNFTNLLSTSSNATLNDIKFSSRYDGTFSIAYIGNDLISTDMVVTYNGDYCKYNTISCCDQTFDYHIITHDFNVYDELKTISSLPPQRYAPYIDMGFIRLTTANQRNNKYWNFSNTTFSTKDFIDKKPLKFILNTTLTALSESLTAYTTTTTNRMIGIDFKYLCPLRIEELEAHSNTTSSLSVSSNYTNVAFQRPYGKGELNNTPLKHFAITDLHVFDSIYNKYVLSGHIPEFLDLTEYEQSIFDNAEQTTDDIFNEYVQLVKYDVTRYLSTLRDEPSLEDGMVEQIIGGSGSIAYPQLIDKVNLVTEPFLVDAKQFCKLMHSSYISGYAPIRNNFTGSYVVQLSNNMKINIAAMKNDYGTIKLDFNPNYYFYPQTKLASINIRNKLHLFLNLDKPGDSGYLNLYETDSASSYSLITDSNGNIVLNLLATLFIKNISTTEPKFVMKAIYFDSDNTTNHVEQVLAIDADKETHIFRSSANKDADQFYLADESLTRLPIDFH